MINIRQIEQYYSEHLRGFQRNFLFRRNRPRVPDEIGHRFRWKEGQLIGAKRRWFWQSSSHNIFSYFKLFILSFTSFFLIDFPFKLIL